MPWVYQLKLNEYRDAEQVQADWQAIAGEAISHTNGGVCVGRRKYGALATVVSTPREPNYSDMEANHSYVDSVTESFDVPSDEVVHLELDGAGTHKP